MVLMASFFSYKTLHVELEIPIKCITLELKNPLIKSLTILELEHFFSWLCNHIEVNAVLITGKDNIFSLGIDLDEFSGFSNSEVQIFFQKLQKIIHICFFLPQTLIFDLKDCAKGAGAELAIGADLRVAKEGVEIKFDHLKNGFVPTCGGIGFLDSMVPQTFIRNWILMGNKIPKEQLVSSGFIQSFYDESNLDSPKKILFEISKIPPIARIQAKRSLLEPLIPKLEKTLIFESLFSLPALAVNDWRKINSKSKENFCSPKELSTLLGKCDNSVN